VRNMILGFAALAPFLTIGLWPVSPLIAIGILFASHMLILYPTLRARSQWLGPVFTRFLTKRPAVWITIDDGPTSDTEDVLTVLERHNARATFFVKGNLASENPDAVRAIQNQGHEIANHSMTHPSATFWCLHPVGVLREIEGCNGAIEAITGRKPGRFRAPVGMKNPFVHPILDRLAMPLIAWTSRGFDGVDGFNPEVAAQRVLEDAESGSIVLLHQGVNGIDGEPASALCLDLVLSGLEDRGISCVIPPNELLLRGSET